MFWCCYIGVVVGLKGRFGVYMGVLGLRLFKYGVLGEFKYDVLEEFVEIKKGKCWITLTEFKL